MVGWEPKPQPYSFVAITSSTDVLGCLNLVHLGKSPTLNLSLLQSEEQLTGKRKFLHKSRQLTRHLVPAISIGRGGKGSVYLSSMPSYFRREGALAIKFCVEFNKNKIQLFKFIRKSKLVSQIFTFFSFD